MCLKVSINSNTTRKRDKKSFNFSQIHVIKFSDKFHILFITFFIPVNIFTLISDVKGGCLYGGNLSKTPTTPKFRGVQVFTYRELEVATNGFDEANVISNGGANGLIYKGVLNDGTLAAIKLLHSEGKQGERAFRIEVSEIILISPV
jgi:hypothetical protein